MSGLNGSSYLPIFALKIYCVNDPPKILIDTIGIITSFGKFENKKINGIIIAPPPNPVIAPIIDTIKLTNNM